MNRHEAEQRCKGVRNLWPRDESEALRYRRQVVQDRKPAPMPSGDRKLATVHGEAFSRGMVSAHPDVPAGFVLLEWLAPDGRVGDRVEPDTGEPEQELHWLHEVGYRTILHAWQSFDESQRVYVGPVTMPNGQEASQYRMPEPVRESDRFKGHEGDPWCGEYFDPEYSEGRGWWTKPLPRERLTAEHPDHQRGIVPVGQDLGAPGLRWDGAWRRLAGATLEGSSYDYIARGGRDETE